LLRCEPHTSKRRQFACDDPQDWIGSGLTDPQVSSTISFAVPICRQGSEAWLLNSLCDLTVVFLMIDLVHQGAKSIGSKTISPSSAQLRVPYLA
jgi:hypothetical protein